MKITLIFLLSVIFLANITDDPSIKPEELISLTAKKWKGTLKYLDYGKNTEVSISAGLSVMQSESDLNVFYFSYEYPDEPHANGIDTITVSENGSKLNDDILIENKYTNDTTFTFTTQKQGEDNKKKAEIKHIYSLKGNKFIIRKEVKYENEKEFFLRNEYNFER
ncbi:MAG TPA: hypothetical protein PKD83_00720 [Ignavibacteria bacterium]|nr:hypothetical protein [Ignavibacteria bacterium]